MIRKLITLIFITFSFTGCKEKVVENSKPKLELISQNAWQLDRFTTSDGQILQNNELNDQALLLYVMNFEFKSDFEVRGVDKSSNTIIDRGVWKFLNNEESINVKLSLLDYDFQILTLTAGKLTLQAPTGNFLSDVGDRINLEFSATQ
jgi:hypothetical protein